MEHKIKFYGFEDSPTYSEFLYKGKHNNNNFELFLVVENIIKGDSMNPSDFQDDLTEDSFRKKSITISWENLQPQGNLEEIEKGIKKLFLEKIKNRGNIIKVL